MSDTIRIQWTWTENDHVRAIRTHQKYSRHEKRLRFLVPAASLLLLVYWLLFEKDALAIAMTAAYAVVVTIFLARPLFLRRWARRVYRQQKALHRPMTLELGTEGLVSTQENGGRGLLAWADCYRWLESADDFVIYQSEALFHLIPKRILDESQVVRVRELLTGGVPGGRSTSV